MGTTLSSVRDASPAESLDGVLARIHDRWVDQVARSLAPAMVPRANFWERWSSVRFVIDQFESHFGLECSLLESLAMGLQPAALARLRDGREEIERTRTDLVAVGRRRGTAGAVAALARQLLAQLRRWCAEFEVAARSLTRADLADQSRQLLDRLEVATELRL